jgi:hypothetical protein
LGSAALLTLPLLARSIFDLCVGGSKSVRDSVGITDQANSEEVLLFLTTGIFFDLIPFLAQLASLVLMNSMQKIIA